MLSPMRGKGLMTASHKTLQAVCFEPTGIRDIANQGVTYVCRLDTLNFQHK